jgi:hypothetical protein
MHQTYLSGIERGNPFRDVNSSPEVIRPVVTTYVKHPLSLRNVEALPAERGIEISLATLRYWWNRFGPIFTAEIRRKRVEAMRQFCQTRLRRFCSRRADHLLVRRYDDWRT